MGPALIVDLCQAVRTRYGARDVYGLVNAPPQPSTALTLVQTENLLTPTGMSYLIINGVKLTGAAEFTMPANSP